MKSSVIFIFLSVVIFSTESVKLTENEKCKLLAESIEDFIDDLYSPNALYSVLHLYLGVTDQDIEEVVESSGYNFATSTIERDAFACKLVECKSRKEVSRVLGVEEKEIDEMYEILLEPILLAGSVENLLDIANVASLLFEWAQVTGYPVMPFNTSFQQLTFLTFQEVQKAMGKKHVSLVFLNSPFPVRVSPKTVLEYFETAKTYSEFEKGVKLRPNQLQRFKNALRTNRNALARAPKNIQATMEFLYALYISGVLNLK